MTLSPSSEFGWRQVQSLKLQSSLVFETSVFLGLWNFSLPWSLKLQSSLTNPRRLQTPQFMTKTNTSAQLFNQVLVCLFPVATSRTHVPVISSYTLHYHPLSARTPEWSRKGCSELFWDNVFPTRTTEKLFTFIYCILFVIKLLIFCKS